MIEQIACGDDHIYVLTESNELWACGYNENGQLGLGHNEKRNILTNLNWTGGPIKQITCGSHHTFVLTENHELWACGYNKDGQLGLGHKEDKNRLTKLEWIEEAIKHVACGYYHTYILTESNELWVCGRNKEGQLGLDGNERDKLTKLEWTHGPIKQVACGDDFTYILSDDNKMWACGLNDSGQLGIGYNRNRNRLTKVDWVTGPIKQVACGSDYTYVETDRNKLWACGRNNWRELGYGNHQNSYILSQLRWYGGAIKQISCGSHHVYIVVENNEFWVWSLDWEGPLEMGHTEHKNILTKLALSEGPIKQVVCSHYHTYLLTESNELWGCGLTDNEYQNILTKLEWTEDDHTSKPIKMSISI